MCGIAGILNFDKCKPVDHAAIESMCQLMVHRGPNEGGYHLDRNVGLGNRRLSIIDISGGQQPMSNEDKTVWITYNGEIYNYKQIRKELMNRGHTFKTSSDTEVILHLYEEMQERCVERLNGMFAFAIWDSTRHVLLLARDRLGIKPLYYFIGSTSVAFSSSIRALLTINDVQPILNLGALHEYLTFRYTIAPQTMIKGILKLQPGHILVVKQGTAELRQYWDLNLSNKLRMTDEECCSEFYHQFKMSVERHLVGEVPLGVLLSGGIDSTAVTAIASECSEKRISTFSVGFANEAGPGSEDYDERYYARLAASHYNTDHHEIVLTGSQFVNGLHDYILHMEEPMADPASIPLYYVAQLAKEFVTIVLSGEGSDELLAGYTFWSAFKGFNRAIWARRVPGPIRDYILKPLNGSVIRSSRLDRYLRLSDLPVSHYPLIVPSYMGNVFSEDAKWALYHERLRELNNFAPSKDIVIAAYQRTLECEFLDQMLYVYTKQWLPDDLLLKADKMTMAHSLELRVPFLDDTLVELAARLPVRMKVRRNGSGGYTTKYILREAFARKLPEKIVQRRKLGFPVPLKELFMRDLKSVASDVFHSQSMRESQLFDREKIVELLEQNGRGIDHSERLWSLLVFGMWLEMFNVRP